jgi:hypothetical protein
VLLSLAGKVDLTPQPTLIGILLSY